MILGGIAVILSLIWLPLGAIAAFGAWPFIAYTIRLVELFNLLPNGVIVLGDISLWLVILFYAALLTWTLAGHRVRELFYGERGNLPTVPAFTIATTLTVIVMVTWRVAFTAPDGNLHITFLDVGSADAILIETPGGRHILINGGPSASMLSDGLGRRLPPLNRRLDWLIIASTQENQLSGLPRVVERITPSKVLWAGNVEASFSARNLDEWFINQNIPITKAETGSELDLGEGAILHILNVNPRGAVLLLEWNKFRALLPVGMNFSAQEELKYGEDIKTTSLLLIADSGYAPINPPKWFANVNPQLIILSVAAGDPDGLPHESTLEAIEDYPLLRTDYNGWVEVITDGVEMGAAGKIREFRERAVGWFRKEPGQARVVEKQAAPENEKTTRARSRSEAVRGNGVAAVSAAAASGPNFLATARAPCAVPPSTPGSPRRGASRGASSRRPEPDSGPSDSRGR